MVSKPLKFKNPLAKSCAEGAKSRKDFAKKILRPTADCRGFRGPNISAAVVLARVRTGIRCLLTGASPAMDSKKLKIDPKHVAAMQACVAHARALLGSSKAVLAAGHANIAYQLATLCLEEIGRRALIGMQCVAEQQTVPPAWPKKHEQDHIKKLFWAFFGVGR